MSKKSTSNSAKGGSDRRQSVRPVRGAVINDLGGRRTERKRRGRRRALIGALVVLVTLLIVGAGGYIVGFSPWLRTERVEVSGTALLSAEEVQRVAGVPLGEPLIGVDTDAVADRVRALAPVREVEITRSWPNTVSIELIERTPSFVVEQKSATGAQEYLVVDATGTPYTTLTKKPDELLPATVTDSALLDDLATVVSALPRDLAEDTTAIEAYSRDSIVLTVTKPPKDTTKQDTSKDEKSAKGKVVQVIWGSADRSDLKASVTLALLQQKGKVYDVSAPDFPAVR